MIAKYMSAFEFFYHFLSTEEFFEINSKWKSDGYDPLVIVFDHKVEIWLVR